MKVAALTIGAQPGAWRELGFAVAPGDIVMLGPVRIELTGSVASGTIASWSLEGESVPASIDGLETRAGKRGAPGSGHPNGAIGIDHLVVVTPSLARTTEALAAIGVDCRRVRDAGGGVRQGFFLVEDLLVEVVEKPGLEAGEPAHFWGITLVVEDIDAAAALLGDHLGRVKEAVQPGRRIATVRPEALGGLPLALISPR